MNDLAPEIREESVVRLIARAADCAEPKTHEKHAYAKVTGQEFNAAHDLID